MKVSITGNAHDAIVELTHCVVTAGFVVTDLVPNRRVILMLGPDNQLIVDGVRCRFEAMVTNFIAELTTEPITLARAGGNQNDSTIRVIFTERDQQAVVTGIFRALCLEAAPQTSTNGTPYTPAKTSWFKRIAAWLNG